MYEQPQQQPQPQPPFETPYIPYAPPTPPTNERKGLKRAGIILLVFIALAAGGVSAYAMVRNASLKDELANEKNNSQALQDENKQLKNNSSGGAEAMISEKLPDGRTISYPDTEANRNILWWSASPDVNEGRDIISLSHKGFQRFLATVDSDILTSVCGTDDALKAQKYNIIVNNFNTTTKELGDSENFSCITMLTQEDNPDADLRVAAQGVLDKADADAKLFAESVTIKE